MPNYEPRHVYVVSFDSADSDLYYFLSHSDIVIDGVSSSNIFNGTLIAPSTRSQTLNPIRANADIGNISFGFSDDSQTLTALLNSKLTGSPSKGLRAKRVQHWVGQAGAAWSSEYDLLQTMQFYNAIGWRDHYYLFNGQDIQRSTLDDIFDVKTTTLTSTLGLTGTTINVNSSAGFSLIQKTGAASDKPNTAAVYLKIQEEIIRCSAIPSSTTFTIDSESSTLSAAASANDTELSITDHSSFQESGAGYVVSGSPEVEYAIKWTGKTDSPHQLTGVTGVTAALDSGATIVNLTGRGVLGSRMTEHTVDTNQSADKRTKIEEYIYYEMNAVQFLYYILTGTLYGNSPEFSGPSHHTLGISAANWVATSEFIAIGSDLWDTADDTAGLVLRFEGLKKTNAKKFIEEQILFITGLYMPVLPTGELGLRRMTGVISDSAYSRVLDEANIISIDDIHYDLDEIYNDFSIDWNYNAINQTYTRTVILSDSDSINKWGAARQLNIKAQGLQGSRHTDSTIANLFNAWRDRHAGPPFRATIQLDYSQRDIKIGDICRLNLTNIPEFTDQNSAYSSLDLSVEVQSLSINYASGVVTVGVFGSTQKASPVIIGNPALDDTFYTSQGSSLAAMVAASPQTLIGTDAGGVLTITGNSSLTGVDDLNSATATTDNEQGIFYYNGDITINSGVTLTISENVEIRCKGTFTNNGTINGKGLGHPGTSTASGTSGYIGSTQAGGGFTFVYTPEFTSTARAVTAGQSHKIGPFNIVNGNTSISGKPGDLRGTSGGKGGDIIDQGSTTAAGGAGGAGGAGLILICRGAVGGVNSSIDLSGVDGTSGSTVDLTYKITTNNFISGTGAGGYPGGLLLILDGNTVTETISPYFVANLGHSLQTGAQAESEVITLLQAINTEKPVHSHFLGFQSPSDAAQSKVSSNLHVLYITESQTAAVDTPSESTLPTAIGVTEQAGTKNSVNVVGLEISATAPSDTNYKAAKIYIKQQSTQGYMYAGQVASGQEVVFWVASDGATYDIKAHSVSITDVESDDYIERTYTVSNGIETQIGTGSTLVSGETVTTNGGLLISGTTLSVYDDSGTVRQKIDLSGTGNYNGVGTLSGTAADEQIVPNNFFDFVDGDGKPDGWFVVDASSPTPSYQVQADSPSNGNYMFINSPAFSTLKLRSKTFKLKPSTKYRARITAQIAGVPAASPDVGEDGVNFSLTGLYAARGFVEPMPPTGGSTEYGFIGVTEEAFNASTITTYDFDFTTDSQTQWGSILFQILPGANSTGYKIYECSVFPWGIISEVDIGIFINDTTFANQGIQLDYNNGTPRAYVGDGDRKYLQFDGTDLSIGEDGGILGVASFPDDTMFLHIPVWWSLDNVNTSTAGSGTVTLVNGNMQLDLTASATDTARAQIEIDNLAVTPTFADDRKFSFRVSFSSVSQSACYVVSGAYDDQSFGFKLAGTQWQAYNINVSTTTTNITVSTGDKLTAVFDHVTSPNEIRYYVNDSLVATHTSNLPSGTSSAHKLFQCFAEYSSSPGGTTRLTVGETKVLYGY